MAVEKEDDTMLKRDASISLVWSVLRWAMLASGAQCRDAIGYDLQ